MSEEFILTEGDFFHFALEIKSLSYIYNVILIIFCGGGIYKIFVLYQIYCIVYTVLNFKMECGDTKRNSRCTRLRSGRHYRPP